MPDNKTDEPHQAMNDIPVPVEECSMPQRLGPALVIRICIDSCAIEKLYQDEFGSLAVDDFINRIDGDLAAQEARKHPKPIPPLPKNKRDKVWLAMFWQLTDYIRAHHRIPTRGKEYEEWSMRNWLNWQREQLARGKLLEWRKAALNEALPGWSEKDLSYNFAEESSVQYIAHRVRRMGRTPLSVLDLSNADILFLINHGITDCGALRGINDSEY